MTKGNGLGTRARLALVAPLAVLLALVQALVSVPVAAYGEGRQGDIRLQAYGGFADVSPGDWYVTSGMLDYVVDNGLISGYDDGRFGPWDNISRGQVATILHRITGSPSADAATFDDVDYSQYYGEAIDWARASGVISGYSGTNDFGPDNPVTREEFATMLSNYADRVGGVDVSSDCAALDGIPGAESVSSWARESMGWAVDRGILSGVVQADGTSRVEPQGRTQRSQAAKMVTVLHRDVLGLYDFEIPESFDENQPSFGSYAPGVVVANGLSPVSASESGSVLTVTATGDPAGITGGNIIAIGSCDDLPFGAVMKVDSISQVGSNIQLVGRYATRDEAYDEMVINEHFTQADLVRGVDNGVEIGDVNDIGTVRVNADSSGAVTVLYAFSRIEGAEFSGYLRISGFDAIVQYDDYKEEGWFGETHRYFNIDTDAVISANTQLKVSAIPEKYQQIKLCSIPIPALALPKGVGIYVNVYLVLDVDGSVSYAASLDADFRATKDYLDEEFTVSGGITPREPQLSAVLEGRIGAQETVSLTVGTPLIGVGAEEGLGAKFSVETHPSLTCMEFGGWFYLEVFAELLGEVTDNLKVTHVVFDDHNSPAKVTGHYEVTHDHAGFVPVCTWDDDEVQQREDIARYIRQRFSYALAEFDNMVEMGDGSFSNHEVGLWHDETSGTVSQIQLQGGDKYSLHGVFIGMEAEDAFEVAEGLGADVMANGTSSRDYRLPSGDTLRITFSHDGVERVALIANIENGDDEPDDPDGPDAPGTPEQPDEDQPGTTGGIAGTPWEKYVQREGSNVFSATGIDYRYFRYMCFYVYKAEDGTYKIHMGAGPDESGRTDLYFSDISIEDVNQMTYTLKTSFLSAFDADYTIRFEFRTDRVVINGTALDGGDSSHPATFTVTFYASQY